MRCYFALAAIAVVAVSATPVEKTILMPWQVGKVYVYNVFSHTFTGFEDSVRHGSAFKAQFIVNVKAHGHLYAKLDKPFYAPFKEHIINKFEIPSNLHYQPIMNMDQTFEIFFNESHVSAIKVPSTLSVANTNFIKGLVGALQVDLSSFELDHNFANSFDAKKFQGLLKKMETDVTGQCETLYSILPSADEWRRELPNFSSEPDLVEIIKSKNYNNCRNSVVFYDDVSESTMDEEKKITKHTYGARFLVGKNGPIYKAEVTSTAIGSHYIRHGQQSGEVFSYFQFLLNSVEENNGKTLETSGEYNLISTLLYTKDFSWIKNDQQTLTKTQALLEELALVLQNPNKMPKGSFLSNFVILVESLSTLNSDQLAHIYNSIGSGRTSKNTAKISMWTIYRDAIALAGTPEAYRQIKIWILDKKIKGEEAAEMISSIGVSLRHPSIELLKDFFKFATTSPVTDLKLVNTSALLTSSQSWARLVKDDQFINKTVIPYLDLKLKHAIENNDTHKAQVYIIALGNLAHPNILKVFAPYLNGHFKVTKYLRTQMVANLKGLASLKNEYVRTVLYGIVKNTAEPYEVRVAAVPILFLAFPTTEMMDVLAFMTVYDHSTHVRAVITNTITSTANLKEPRYTELANAAQSVMHLITKEKFGSIYSTVDFDSEYIRENNQNDFFGFLSIGSKNTPVPKYIKSISRLRGFLFSDKSEISLSVSDVQDLLDNILEVLLQPNAVDPKFKYSAKQIVEMLNIKQTVHEPLEGALFMDRFNQQNVITFNKRDLSNFISDSIESIPNLLKGIDSQYSKITIVKKDLIIFPLVTGLPFLYEYKEPSIIIAQAHAALKYFEVDPESIFMKGSVDTTIDLTYASEVLCTVFFQDIFEDHLYEGTGVSSNVQVQLPLKINVKLSPKDIKIKFEELHKNKDIKLFHLNIVPHISVFKGNTLTYHVEPLKRSVKTISADVKLGDLVGTSYQLQGHSYSSDYKELDKLYNGDYWSNARRLFSPKDIALTEFNLKYLAKESEVKSTTFTLYFDTLYYQNNTGKLGLATPTKHVEANSIARRDEIIKKVSSGIDSATVHLFDFSAKIEGQKQAAFVFTGAFASSVVDSKFQVALFASSDLYKTNQINGVFKLDSESSKMNSLNFEETLNDELIIAYESNIQYELYNFTLKGYGTRTKEYTESLKKDPMAKHCMQDIRQQNIYQNNCLRMIIKAYAPDYFKTTITYNDKDLRLGYVVDYAYNRYLKEKYTVEKEPTIWLKSEHDKNVEFETKVFYYDNFMEMKLNNALYTYNWDDVATQSYEYYPYSMSFYRPVNTIEIVTDYTIDHDLPIYCAVDDNKVWTFSGRSYDYAITGSWHVVMLNDANELGKDLVILVRRPSPNNEEVYISYKTEAGNFFELEINPDNIEVKTNAKKTSSGALSMYWDKDEEKPLLQYYSIGDGVYMFEIHENSLRLIYDKHRLIIFTNDYYGSTIGICGQSSTEVYDDYLSPWGIVDRPELYGASFSLNGEFSDPQTADWKEESKLKAYKRKIKFTDNIESILNFL